VTAVGHETDVPLVDNVADVRASTPTDAAKRIVPDVSEELDRIRGLRTWSWRSVRAQIDAETHRLDAIRQRPALADPTGQLGRWSADVSAQLERARRAALACVGESATEVARL